MCLCFLLSHYLSSREMMIGWLMFWFATMEVKGSIPSYDTLFMIQSSQVAYMFKGGQQMTHTSRGEKLTYILRGFSS
jgi:hypothetical protein